MAFGTVFRDRRLGSIFCLSAAFAGCDNVAAEGASGSGIVPGNGPAQDVFVAREGDIRAYDALTGEERPGAIQDVATPVDMKALDNGIVGVNLTTRGEVLFFDSETMLEVAPRPHSSFNFGLRPVHSYVSPKRAGRQYWIVLNDGVDGRRETNSAGFVDIDPNSSTYLELVGEAPLGVGHHIAAFSTTQERVAITNIADCQNVISVYDFSDVTRVRLLTTLTGEEAGFDAPDPAIAAILKGHGGVAPQVAASIEAAQAAGTFDPRFCDPSYQRGQPPAPHGCATSTLSGKVYCNLTSSGEIAVVDIDADPPSFDFVPTSGLYGGHTDAHPGGRYIYSLQEAPREGNGGEHCQIGQLAVIDAATDSVVTQLPLGYYGHEPCPVALVDTPAETAQADHTYFTLAGDRLYLPTAGGFGFPDARVDQLLVLDTSDPAKPVQLDSMTLGVHTGHSSAAMSGDGSRLFVTHTMDGTVSEIDVASTSVELLMPVASSPLVISAFGEAVGPSY